MQEKDKIQSVSILGAGNVGWHLAQAMYDKGLQISSVYNRSWYKAKELSDQVNSFGIKRIEELPKDSDLYLLCVVDDVIDEIGEQLYHHLGKESTSIVAHVSGNKSSDILSNFRHFGAFYPLQTFNRNRDVYFQQIPILINGGDQSTEIALMSLAQQLSGDVRIVTNMSKRAAHLAAVIVNNFSHHLLYKAHQLMQDMGVEGDVLTPLIRETFDRLHDPDLLYETQSGPAKRHDKGTLEDHLKLIENDRHLKNIYKSVTQSIMYTYKSEHHENTRRNQ